MPVVPESSWESHATGQTVVCRSCLNCRMGGSSCACIFWVEFIQCLGAESLGVLTQASQLFEK